MEGIHFFPQISSKNFFSQFLKKNGQENFSWQNKTPLDVLNSVPVPTKNAEIPRMHGAHPDFEKSETGAGSGYPVLPGKK